MFPIEPYRESLPDMPAMTVTPFDRMFQSARLSQNVRDVRIAPNVRDLPNAPMVLPVTIATRQNRQRRTLVLPHAQNLPKRTQGSDGRSIAGLPHTASGGPGIGASICVVAEVVRLRSELSRVRLRRTVVSARTTCLR